MMNNASTILCLASAYALGLATALALLRARRHAQSDEAIRTRYLREHAVRLALAQHWARGGMLSDRTEAWRPVCTSAAIAALAYDDVGDLLAELGRQHDLARDDAELGNVLAQARAELAASRDRLPLELLTGRTSAGAAGWNSTELARRARDCLDAGRQAGAALLADRRDRWQASTQS